MPLKDRVRARRLHIKATDTYVDQCPLKESDPIGFEVFYTKLSQSINNARDLARQVAASPEMRRWASRCSGCSPRKVTPSACRQD